MKKIPFIIYILLLHLAALALFLKSDTYIKMLEYWQGPSESYTQYFKTMSSFYQKVDKNLPTNSVIFIGDSLIQGMAVTNIAPKATNFGIGNDTTMGVLKRLPHYQSIFSAKHIIISIGHNDLKYRTLIETSENIERIIKQIPSNIPITLSAILPVSEQYVPYTNNDTIKKLNESIETMVAKYANVNFLNINYLLSNKTGELQERFHVGDGVHLNKKGYYVWIKALTHAVNQEANNT